MTDVVADYCALNETLLREDAEAARIFLARGIPRPGDVLRNPELADTLAAIRRGGADALYHGALADRIVRTLNRLGNLMSLDDLAAHRTTRPFRCGCPGTAASCWPTRPTRKARACCSRWAC